MCYDGGVMPVSPPPKSSSPLGQIRDEVVGELKKTAADTAKAVVSEPKKILESILGQASETDGENPGVEDMSGGTQDPQTLALQQQKMAQKQAQDQQQSGQKLQLHRQRLAEEKAYYAQRKQEEEVKVQQEAQQQQQAKQQQIVQLQHERAKDDVLGGLLKQQEGSKESKAWGAG